MEGMIILVSVVVIIWCWYTMSNRNKVLSDKQKPVEVYTQEEFVENTPKFSPPVYELEQWIKDNWKKIKVTPLPPKAGTGYDIGGWAIESEIYTGNLEFTAIVYCHYNTFTATNSGLNYEEVSHLKLIYESIVFDRQRKLNKLKAQRSRKQLARKLQQLGYGSGEYESK